MCFDIIQDMRNKRLIILLSVLGGIVVLIVVMSAVFTVYHIEARCISEYSPPQEESINEVSEQVVEAADDFMYRSIFLFDEEELIDTVNSNVIRAEAVNVVCVFPNKVQIEYKYVDDRLQVYDESSGKYIIAGASGKITRISDNDESSSQNSDIAMLIPAASPDNATEGSYLYNEKEAFDRMAINTFISYAESLKSASGNGGKVFRAAYRTLDFSDALKSGMTGGAKIKVVMRSGFEFDIYGSILESGFTFNDKPTLEKAVGAMVSFYYTATNSDIINSDSDGKAIVQYINGNFTVAFAA